MRLITAQFVPVVLLLLAALLVLPLAAPCVLAVLPTSALYDDSVLTLGLHLSNSLLITPSGPQPSVERVTGDLSWYPRDSYRETLENISTTPTAAFVDDAYRYEWSNPDTGSRNLALDATIRTTSDPLPVTQKVPFPIASLPPEIARYTEPGTLIDSDEAITRQALQLSQGKDDLFDVVNSVAEWVTTNVQYNLSSVSADATEPSSWVMTNRKGVCKEMTALFISMLRSLGIPARFVSGVAYTNLPEFANPWGGHAWAEVYFPGTGWVPFDPTYGTYGYVDATHIKLQDSFDAQQSSIDFTMLGRDATLVTQGLDFTVQVLGTEPRTGNLFTVTLAPFDNVSLNSYDLLIATVTNNAGQYVSSRLTLEPTEGMEIIGNPDRNVLLLPFETRRVTYLVRVNALAPGFSYTFPVSIYAGFSKVATASFQARQTNPSYDEGFFDAYLEAETAPSTNNDLLLSCLADEPDAYVNSTVTLHCAANNTAATRVAETCIGGTCAQLRLPANTVETFNATLRCDAPGDKALLATAKTAFGTADAIARYACLDQASLSIVNLSAPAALGYNEEGSIDFLLQRTSETLPENLTIAILHDNFQEEWQLDTLIAPQRFTLDIHGENLDLSGNKVTILVNYTDPLGAHYTTQQSLVITPRDFTLWEQAQVLMGSFQHWLETQLA